MRLSWSTSNPFPRRAFVSDKTETHACRIPVADFVAFCSAQIEDTQVVMAVDEVSAPGSGPPLGSKANIIGFETW